MWEIHTLDQALTFLFALLWGAGLCLLYDPLRAFRACRAAHPAAAAAADIIYWIISAFAFFLFLLSRTNGQPRGYAIAALLLGFAAARAAISPFWFRLLKAVLSAVLFVLRGARRISDGAIDKANRFIDLAGRRVRKICKNVLKTAKKLLKNN